MLITAKPVVGWFAVAAAVLILAGCGGAQSRYASYMKRAQEYYSDGNYVKASVEYRNAMRISPKDPTAAVMAAECAEKLGKVREAAAQFQNIVDANPTNLQARAGLGRVTLLGGLTDAALKIIDVGLEQTPNDVPLLTLRSAARNQLQDLPGATADADRALQLAPHDEQAVSVRAGLYRQAGQLQQAIELVSSAVSATPKVSGLRVILAELLLAAGEPQKAEKEARALVELKPQELGFRTQLAMLLLRDKKPNDARAVLEDAVKAFPDNDQAKLMLVDFVSNQRSHAEGEQVLRAFITKEPKNEGLRLTLASILQRSGAKAEARSVYNGIIERNGLEPMGLEARDRLAALAVTDSKNDEASKLIGEVLSKNPQDNEALLLRASLAMDKADAVTAIGDLRGVLRDQPNNLVARKMLARAYTLNGEPALAEEALRAAAQTAPTDPMVRLELARLLTSTKRADAAVALLEPAVRDAPADANLRVGLIEAYLSKRDFVAARTAAEDLKVLQPKSAAGYYYAGLVAEAADRKGDDEKELEHALQLQPDAFNVLSELVKLRLSRGRTAEAVALIKEQSRQQPANAELENLLGQIYLQQKNLPLAAQTLTHASTLSPRWWVPLRNLALVRLAAKDNNGAIAAYEASIEASPSQVQPVTELAQLYEAQNRIDEAIALYEAHHARDARASQVTNNLAMLLVTYKDDHLSLDRARDLTAAFASASEANLLDTYGWVRFKRAEFAVAVPALERAVQHAPDSRQIRYHLGMAELRAGQAGRARTDLEAALAGGAKFPGADEAKTTLATLGRQSG